MAKLGRRKAKQEMTEVWRREKELGHNNQVCAANASISVETIVSVNFGVLFRLAREPKATSRPTPRSG